MDIGVILRDPITIALLGIVASIIIYRWQKQRKRLSYSLIQNTSLVDVSDHITNFGELEIYLDGQKVEELTLLTFKIQNIGNVSILAKDFDHPLTIQLGANIKIINYSMEDARNDQIRTQIITNLEQEIRNEQVYLVFPSTLLNKKDWFSINILIAHLKGIEVKPIVSAHIVGVEKLETSRTITIDWSELFPNLAISLFLLMFLTLLILLNGNIILAVIILILNVIITSILIMILTLIVREKRGRN